MKALACLGLKKVSVDEVLASFDADGDQQIDLAEWKAGLRPATLAMMAKRLDGNGLVAGFVDDKGRGRNVAAAEGPSAEGAPSPPSAARPQQPALAVDPGAALDGMTLSADEALKVERIKAGELQRLEDSPADMAMVEAVFAACDADGNGEIDMEEMVARYGKQARHILSELHRTGFLVVRRRPSMFHCLCLWLWLPFQHCHCLWL